MTQENEALIYTTEYIIDKGNSIAPNLTTISVYKLLYLAYKKLNEVGIDIKLPYSWYLHGTMIESTGYQSQTGLALGNYFCDGNSALNFYNASFNVSLDRDTIQTIKSVVDDLLEKFSESGVSWKIDDLIKVVYDDAPYEFQRTYKFELIKLDFNKISSKDLLQVLDKLKAEYPADCYIDLYPTFLRWDDTMRLAIQLGIANSDKKEMILDFWNIFAAKLRTTENENLLDSEIRTAVNFFNNKYAEYRQKLRITRERYLLQLTDSPLLPLEEEIINDLNCIAFDSCVEME